MTDDRIHKCSFPGCKIIGDSSIFCTFVDENKNTVRLCFEHSREHEKMLDDIVNQVKGFPNSNRDF